ncbi:MAG: ribonuclease HII [Candidatus Saccharimonadales bacterium]
MSSYIVGIDEAGRGAWAGPLVAAAVMLPDRLAHLEDVKDSKQLTAKKRQELSRYIAKQAVSVGIGWVDPDEIDNLGLQLATTKAMDVAYKQLPKLPADVIVDGHINYLEHVDSSEAIIRADQLVPAVAAASIIAKHHRDMYMKRLAGLYNVYGFDRHVGYGTKYHQEALANNGVCIIHRLSYKPIREFLTFVY